MSNEIIYGVNSVTEALKSGNRTFFRIIAARETSQRISETLKLARSRNIRIDFLEKKTMDKICQSPHHQGLAAEVSPLKTYEIFEALSLENGNKKAMWLAVDSVTDPGNLGSLIRSAVCLGFSAIVLPKNRTAAVTGTVAKISSGAVEKIRLVEVVNLNQAILELKEKGFWIYGADAKGESIHNADFAFPLMLVVGAEGEGLHLKTKEHCDKIVSIPQRNDFDSLNAAVAGAIVMYEISKRNK